MADAGVGDVKFNEVQHPKAVTPVLGGVGSMTIACLLHNTVQSAKAIAAGREGNGGDPYLTPPTARCSTVQTAEEEGRCSPAVGPPDSRTCRARISACQTRPERKTLMLTRNGAWVAWSEPWLTHPAGFRPWPRGRDRPQSRDQSERRDRCNACGGRRLPPPRDRREHRDHAVPA